MRCVERDLSVGQNEWASGKHMDPRGEAPLGRVSEDKALRNPDHWGPQEREVTITKCNRHNRKKLNSTAIREQGSFEKRLKRSYSSPRPFEQLKAETGLTGPANE